MVSYFFCLPRMFLRVVGLCLGEIARRVCHELRQGRRTAETIGLTLKLRVDGAVGLYVFAICKTHRAHVAVLAGHGHSGCGQTRQNTPATANVMCALTIVLPPMGI